MTGFDLVSGADGARRIAVAPASDALYLALAVAAGYLVGSEAAFRFADATGLQAVFFIPSGITLAALVLTSPSRWIYVLAAAACAELVQDLRAGLNLGQSVGFVVANVAEPVVGALIVAAWVRGRPDLARLDDVRRFIGGGVVIGPAVGATIGALVDRQLGGDEFLLTLWQWWLGDALGVLLVAGPLLALRASPDRRALWSASGLTLAAGSIALTAAVLWWSDLPLMFIVLTGVVVAGARFGVRAVTLVAAVIAATGVLVVVVGDGAVMVGVSDATGLLVIKLKFLVFTTGGMIVAAEVHQRDLLVLEQARLQAAAEEEHRLVTRFQRSILPPEVMSGANFTARGRYFPASSGIGVGGDWYDVVQLSDGRVYISVGDVVGHGPDAAVAMSQIRIAMSILAREAERPSIVLDQIDVIARTVPGASCSTAWVGYFDPVERQLTYASAGHPPGFVMTPHRVVRLDGPVAAPIGVRCGVAKPESRIDVSTACSLLLYTDGLIERREGSVDQALADIERSLESARRSGVELDLDELRPLAGATDDTVILHVSLRPEC